MPCRVLSKRRRKKKRSTSSWLIYLAKGEKKKGKRQHLPVSFGIVLCPTWYICSQVALLALIRVRKSVSRELRAASQIFINPWCALKACLRRICRVIWDLFHRIIIISMYMYVRQLTMAASGRSNRKAGFTLSSQHATSQGYVNQSSKNRLINKAYKSTDIKKKTPESQSHPAAIFSP